MFYNYQFFTSFDCLLLTDVSYLLQLDGIPKTIRVGDVTSKAIELTSRVSLAGLDLDSAASSTHPAVYTAGLMQGFVGCLMEVKINGGYQIWKAKQIKIASCVIQTSYIVENFNSPNTKVILPGACMLSKLKYKPGKQKRHIVNIVGEIS